MLLIHITMNLKYWYIKNVKNIWIRRQPYGTWHWWPGNQGWLGPCIPTILLVLVPIWQLSLSQDYIFLNLFHVSSSHQLCPKVEALTLCLQNKKSPSRSDRHWDYGGAPVQDQEWWSCVLSSSSTGRCWTQLPFPCCMSSSAPLSAWLTIWLVSFEPRSDFSNLWMAGWK